MANLDKLIKDEFRRLIGRETRKLTSETRSGMAGLRQRIRALELQVKSLSAQGKTLESAAKMAVAQQTEKLAEKADEIRVSGANIRKLRERLGISQGEFGALVGVSGQSVYMWERKPGRLRLKATTKARIAQIRGMGKRAAAKLLKG
jgi:DNA-binding transcriptional regulator YiaG